MTSLTSPRCCGRQEISSIIPLIPTVPFDMKKLDHSTPDRCHGNNPTVDRLASLDETAIFLPFEDAEDTLGSILTVIVELDLENTMNSFHLFFKPQKPFDYSC
jgi:hypothetical protein